MARKPREEELLKPYATQIGRTTIEWNDLYESLGLLFAAILFPSEAFSRVALSVWHSIPSDRTQRDILAAAAAARFADQSAFPKAMTDVSWLLKKVNDLADPRNNAVHAPLTFTLDFQGQALSVAPSDFFGHPRALKLEGTDVLAEFEWAVAYAEKLKLFARNITASIQMGTAVHTWPDRPQLPNRDQFRSRKG